VTTTHRLGIHAAGELKRISKGWFFRADRPGPDWYAHGTTPKTTWLLHACGLSWATIHKQRWLHVPSGTTLHDRPPFEVPWSCFGLVAVLLALRSWWSSPRGLLEQRSPWHGRRPSRRTLQRWLARLATDGLHWHAAMREVVVDRLAPSTLEELFPAGVDPPGTVARFGIHGPEVWKLWNGLEILAKAAPPLSVPWSVLLVEAHRRRMADTHR
jgi:hypothetical protein